MGFWDRLLGRDVPPPPSTDVVAAAPTADDINAALDRVERLVADPAIPAVVRSRALRVTQTVHKTLPRLALLGLGSYDSYSVVATATDYLPEAIGGYLRLPRDWADSRPVDGGKTSLLLLIDQLDLLAVTMDAIYDAANTTDAAALISHGRFLKERFGHAQAPELNLAVPTPQPLVETPTTNSLVEPGSPEEPARNEPASRRVETPAPNRLVERVETPATPSEVPDHTPQSSSPPLRSPEQLRGGPDHTPQSSSPPLRSPEQLRGGPE